MVDGPSGERRTAYRHSPFISSPGPRPMHAPASECWAALALRCLRTSKRRSNRWASRQPSTKAASSERGEVDTGLWPGGVEPIGCHEAPVEVERPAPRCRPSASRSALERVCVRLRDARHRTGMTSPWLRATASCSASPRLRTKRRRLVPRAPGGRAGEQRLGLDGTERGRQRRHGIDAADEVGGEDHGNLEARQHAHELVGLGDAAQVVVARGPSPLQSAQLPAEAWRTGSTVRVGATPRADRSAPRSSTIEAVLRLGQRKPPRHRLRASVRMRRPPTASTTSARPCPRPRRRGLLVASRPAAFRRGRGGHGLLEDFADRSIQHRFARAQAPWAGSSRRIGADG